ncbi:hypothetical protein ABT214_02545 [Micromonospora purpureochromogenes]|uniref:hypothetical protein n=1 Tax=Micromonospora purpureochromogenes TaxID=47872 RepID=UPI00332C3116
MGRPGGKRTRRPARTTLAAVRVLRPFLEGLRAGAADRDGNGIISVREAFEYAAVRMVDREHRQTHRSAADVGDLTRPGGPN